MSNEQKINEIIEYGESITEYYNDELQYIKNKIKELDEFVQKLNGMNIKYRNKTDAIDMYNDVSYGIDDGNVQLFWITEQLDNINHWVKKTMDVLEAFNKEVWINVDEIKEAKE